MKNRLHKLILSLLIAVMCANCALPAVAAAEMSETEKKYLEDGIAASKKWFLQLYGQLWKEGGLEAKLAEAVNKGVDEKMNSMLPGTRSARMMLEENQKEALGLVIKEFAPAYEEFLQLLQKRFTDENNRELEIFYENLTDEAVAKINDSNVKMKISKIGKCDPEQVAQSLRKNHKGMFIKPDSTEIDISASDFSKQINSVIIEKMGEGTGRASTALLGGAFGILAIANPLIGAVGIAVEGLAALGIWGTFRTVPDKLKAHLTPALSESLTKQQPTFYWEAMEGDVRVIFEEVYAMFQLDMERLNEQMRAFEKEAEDLANDPEVKALLEERRATAGQ